MDWRKSKHILVVALIILNVFLFFGVQRHRGHVRRVNDREQMTALTEELKKSGIVLDADIPKYEKKIFTLEVAYERENPRALNEKLYNEEGNIDYIGDQKVTLRHGKECFTFRSQNEMQYDRKLDEGRDVKVIMSEQDVVHTLVPDFFQRLGISMDDMALESITPSDNGKRYELHYGMVFEEIPLERAYTKVLVDHDEVVSMERKWFVVERKNASQLELTDPIKVLFSLVGNRAYDGKRIVGLDVCQYFNTSMSADVTDNENILRGRTMPAWRITFDDGNVLIIDE